MSDTIVLRRQSGAHATNRLIAQRYELLHASHDSCHTTWRTRRSLKVSAIMTRMSRQSDRRSVINTNSVRGMGRCHVVQALWDERAYRFHMFILWTLHYSL